MFLNGSTLIPVIMCKYGLFSWSLLYLILNLSWTLWYHLTYSSDKRVTITKCYFLTVHCIIRMYVHMYAISMHVCMCIIYACTICIISKYLWTFIYISHLHMYINLQLCTYAWCNCYVQTHDRCHIRTVHTEHEIRVKSPGTHAKFDTIRYFVLKH